MASRTWLETPPVAGAAGAAVAALNTYNPKYPTYLSTLNTSQKKFFAVLYKSDHLP